MPLHAQFIDLASNLHYMMIDIDTLLAWGGAYKKLSPGEIIFQEGSNCNFYYQVVSGQVKWYNLDDDGKEYLQNLIEPGESFGELPLFDDGVYAATSVAIKETIVIRLHKATFHQILKEHPELHFAFSKLLTQRLRFKFFILKEVAIHDPEQRIISLLNYMKINSSNICPACDQIKLTRQQIADMTGLRVETVIRAMRNMNEKGIIRISKGKVYLGNMTSIIPEKCMA